MKFRRITTSGDYLPEIDGLRFVAILAVILYHIPGNWLAYAASRYPAGVTLDGVLGDFYHHGFQGVLLFFTISGFILGLPFARQYLVAARPVSLARFYRRRVTRLEPPYLISMLLLFAMGIVLGRFSFGHDFPHLLASLFYVHNVVYGTESTINVAAWSLEVEVLFYLLAPLFCWLFLRSPRRWHVLLPGAIVLLGMLQYVAPMKLLTLAKFAHYFLAGILAAAVFAANPAWVKKRSYWGDATLVILVLTFGLVSRFAPRAADLVFPWCFAAALLFGMKSVVGSAMLRAPLIATTGGMCYTIYLYHGRLITLPIVFVLSKVPLSGHYPTDILILTAILVPLTLLISAMLFVVLERPFMDPAWVEKARAGIRLRLERLGWLRSTATRAQ